MNLQRFQQKLIRRLSSPMEYLHAITAHWLLIFVIAVGVASVVAVQVVRSRPIYDATATLILTPPERHMLVRPGGAPREGGGRNRNRDFLAEQMGILQSASVYKLVVTTLGHYKRPRRQSKEPADVSAVEEIYDELKERIVDFLVDESAEAPVDSADVRLKSAMGRFSRRVFVNPRQKSRQIKLRILGGNRAVLERELETWIESYRRVLKRLSDEDSLQLENHIATWTAMTKSASDKLDQFRKDNPEVRRSLLEAAKDNLVDQRSYVRRLQAEILLAVDDEPEDLQPVGDPGLQNFPAGERARTVDDDAAIKELTRKISGLNLRRIDVLSKYGPKSYVIRKLDESVASHQKELDRMRNELLVLLSEEAKEVDVATPTPATATVADERPRKARRKTSSERLQDAIDFAKREERKAQREVERLEASLSDFNDLKVEHQATQMTLQKYEEYKNFIDDSAKSNQTITVRVLDIPTASAVPVNANKFKKVALGGAVGLLAGFVLALAAEVLCRTVRFKKDVVDELDLEVVGVLPEK